MDEGGCLEGVEDSEISGSNEKKEDKVLEDGKVGNDLASFGESSLSKDGRTTEDEASLPNSKSDVDQVREVKPVKEPADTSFSPTLWGHKVKMMDELDRKNKRNVRRSELRKKKRNNEAEGCFCSRGSYVYVSEYCK